MLSNKIVFIIPYFGKFPEWAPLYFETIRKNASIDFLFYTDCDFKKYEDIPNALFHYITFDEYIEKAKAITKVNFSPANAYKLCDLRPLFSLIHFEDIKHYDFYGWTDMDILFGDIRSFYTDDLLSQFEVFSTHSIRISGHMALFKNIPKYRTLYKKIYRWRNHLEHPYFVGIDEHGVTNALTMTFFDKLNEKMGWGIDNFFTRWLKKLKTKKLYMLEQYTTPFTSIPWIDFTLNSHQPSEWFYKDGDLTNSRDGHRKFIYLHFMNFKSSTYRHDETKAPWEGLQSICFASVVDMKKGIKIDNLGINKI